MCVCPSVHDENTLIGKWIEFIFCALVYHNEIQVKCDFHNNKGLFAGVMAPFVQMGVFSSQWC